MTVAIVIVVSFLAFVVLFTLAAVHGTRVAGQVMGTRIKNLHEAAESILDTEQIPAQWLEAPPADSGHCAQWQQRQVRRAVRKLGRLQTYMERTPSISDVESREYILAELERIGTQWQRGDLNLPH